ncbi:MAG: AAA family ATPase [Planctomycetales bacterium]|nr:AAA family ATPase [Planctomycetales bacterium]NIM09104.1 AAA family ATPase [Planctomycetales bacterium]NIN08575.1 AAA family ATPase [Planctomycetales bacterium]NIN77697.1 AAA family ATPase [Planctomycetales bacterium]NIO34873.1 AAA family ATPase [Planctomycetales bacterium]
MYTDYWQFTRPPFETGCDPAFYYPSQAHQSALLKLRYAIENRRGGGLLVGGSGLGKTMLIESLQQTLPDSIGPVVHIVYPKMSAQQLLAYLAAALGAPAEDATVDQHVRHIENQLHKTAEGGRHVVLVMDEAHLLEEAGGLECVRLLWNFQSQGQPLLTLLLLGQAILLPILDRLPDFEERLGVKSLLRPLNLEETASYVNHRLNVAGASRPIFENEALDALFAISGGVPRRINRLCDLALLVGFADQLPAIGARQIEAVHEELVAVTPE